MFNKKVLQKGKRHTARRVANTCCEGGTYPGGGGLPALAWEVPTQGPCEQTENITFRHPSNAGGNYQVRKQ